MKKLSEAETAAKAAAKAVRVAAKAAAAAAAAPAEEQKEKDHERGSDDGAEPAAEDEDEEDGPEREYVALQQFTFSDAFITSVSTGGSGGEDRLTENISIAFGSFQYKFTDWVGAQETKQPPAEKSILYDPLRNIVKPGSGNAKTESEKKIDSSCSSSSSSSGSSGVMQYL